MNLEQYRLGNILESGGSLCEVVGINRNSLSVNSLETPGVKSKKSSPLALGCKILLDFGFRKSDHKWGSEYYLVRNQDEVYFSIENWTEEDPNSIWNNYWFVKQTIKPFHLKYVHQLQNIYFALTGEELILKTQA
jgi:hypothetical protein